MSKQSIVSANWKKEISKAPFCVSRASPPSLRRQKYDTNFDVSLMVRVRDAQ